MACALPSPARPYMPANGSEGRWFTARWCDRCACDNGVRDPLELEEHGCQILATSSCGVQPEEWVVRDGQPECDAFVAKDPFDAPLLPRAVIAELPFRPPLPPVGRPACAGAAGQ